MICSYDELMVPYAQQVMGEMLDFAVYGLDMDLCEFYDLFLNSRFSRCFERGDTRTIMGSSGIELCYDITGKEMLSDFEMRHFFDHSIVARSPEFWAGWALSFYQWTTSLRFSEIDEIKSINSIVLMYSKYHEMDITHFVSDMNEMYKAMNTFCQLKKIRTRLGISQSELSRMTEIPLKTIQQYEQQQKNINHAQVDYLVRLSRALKCDIELLLERVD